MQNSDLLEIILPERSQLSAADIEEILEDSEQAQAQENSGDITESSFSTRTLAEILNAIVLELIEYYFKQNCARQEILDLLSKRHGIDISLSTSKRMLTDLDLKRINIQESPLEDICYGVMIYD
ncbi:hypothetical protein QAD02_013616 [Eretmocerus hayati]|uniref:Uncharacterized protein n=1 Tax=Eretmocerus hayati TaxID=131215 RepID=A0ACC2P2N3_9HYME|nr:hypothetical protein QAD02_013616 [Eretmocerus hayati]